MSAASIVKAHMAAVVDKLATIGQRMPALAALTVSAGGITATITPAPPLPPQQQPAPVPACRACGR